MRPLLAEAGPRTVALSKEPPAFANVAEGQHGQPGRVARGVRLSAVPPDWSAAVGAPVGGKEQSQLLSSDSDDSSSLESRWAGPPARGLRERLREVCDGNAWQGLVILVIVLNTLSMAIECDTYRWSGWRPINNSFLIFFVFELAVRLLAFGARFFTDPNEFRGNLFDFCLVVLGVGDLWLRPLLLQDHKKAGANKAFAVLRQIRILRVFRSVRLIKQVPELRRLCYGFADALQAAGWLLVLFSMVVFFVGLMLTIFIGNNADLWEDEEDQRLIEEYFGTMSRTVFTMFRYVTLDDWSYISSLVMMHFPLMSLFFCAYEFFMAFTVLALLTGVIAENYQESGRKQDMEDSRIKFQEFLQDLEPLFRDSKAGALCPEKASVDPLLDLRDVTDARQASTALPKGAEAGSTRLRVLSLQGFVAEQDGRPQMVKIAGGGIEEFRTIEALRPCCPEHEHAEMILDAPLDMDYGRKSRVEAVHPLVSAVISQGPPGCTDTEAIGFLHSFDKNRDNMLNFKDEFSRGMQLYVHGDRKPKKLDLQVIHTDVRRIGDLLGCPLAFGYNCPVKPGAKTPVEASPRHEAWKKREAQLEQRLRKIEDLLATIIRTTAPGAALGHRGPLPLGAAR